MDIQPIILIIPPNVSKVLHIPVLSANSSSVYVFQYCKTWNKAEAGNTQFALVWRIFFLIKTAFSMLNKEWWSPLTLPGYNCQFLLVSFIFSTVCKDCFSTNSLWERDFSEWGLRPDPGHSLTNTIKDKTQVSPPGWQLTLGLWIHQTGFYMEVPEDECVWFNLLLIPEHLLEIPKENRDLERTKQTSSPTPLWWSLVIDVTTGRTCLPSDGPQSPGPQQEDHNHNHGPPNLENQTFTSYYISQHATNNNFVEWMREYHPQDNKRWSGAKSLDGGSCACLITCKMWESVGLFCTTHTPRTHTHHTCGTHTHRTQHTHNTHTETFSWE